MTEIKFRFRDSPFQNEVLSGTEFYTLLSALKSCSNAKYLPANKEWAIDITAQNLKKLIKYMSRDKFNQYAEFVTNKNQIVGMDFLLPFQVTGVKALLDGKQLLADDVGLGKTLQLLAYTQQRNYKRVLIVTPAPLKRQWQEEIAKFFEEKSTVIDGTTTQRERQFREYVDYQERYLIVNYEQLKKTNAYLFEHYWDCVLFDEVHRLKNSKTFAHKAAKKLNCGLKLGATATPFVNVPMELFNIANFLHKKFFNWTAFTSKYCIYDTIWNGTEEISVIVGYNNLNDLNNDLSPLMIRRKKQEVMKELPARSYKNCYVPMKTYQKRLHDALFAASKEAYDKEHNNVLAYLTLARLAANSTNQVVLSKSELAPIVEKIESAKLDFLLEEINQLGFE